VKSANPAFGQSRFDVEVAVEARVGVRQVKRLDAGRCGTIIALIRQNLSQSRWINRVGQSERDILSIGAVKAPHNGVIFASTSKLDTVDWIHRVRAAGVTIGEPQHPAVVMARRQRPATPRE